MLEVGESCGTEGKLGEGWVHGDRESGITDPFLSRAPWGVGFPQAASTGDTCSLEFGDLMT
jgi:hypothetical protein